MKLLFLSRLAILIFLLTNSVAFAVRVLAISVPKSGTHLMGKLLRKLGYVYQPLNTHSAIRIAPENVAKLKDKQFCSAHFIASRDMLNAVQRYGFKVIYLYRDPRDQIVSNAHYIKNVGVALWDASELSLQDLISRLIVDYSCMYYTKIKSTWNDVVLKDVGSVKDFYDLYVGWHACPDAYVTTFEKLVGAAGGGNDVEQYQEIFNILQHLGYRPTESAIKELQDDLFGGTATFRSGQIGEWKLYFTEEDKKVFKQVAGQLLIDLGYEKDLDW